MIDPAQEVIRQVKEKLTIGKLDSVYDRASQSTIPYLFFRSLIEYVSLFKHSEILNAIAQAIVEEGRNQRAPIDELQKMTLQEMRHAHMLIKDFVAQNTITDGEIAFSLELLEGQVASTSHPVEAKYQALNDLFHMLATGYYLQSKLFITQFAKIAEATDSRNNVIVSTTYGPGYKKWHEAYARHQRQKLTEDWFSWQEIYDLYQTHHDYEVQQKELSETGKTLGKIFHSHTFQKIERLVNDTHQTPENMEAMELYRSYLCRVHFHTKSLLAGLEQKPGDKDTEETGPRPSPRFHSINEESGVLTIHNQEITFSGKRKRLLELVMSKPDKEWRYDDIYCLLEDPNLMKLEDSMKKEIYESSRGIINRIAKESGVKNFLLCTRQIIKVNPIYIA